MAYIPHSAEALDYLSFETLESLIHEHLPPGLDALALRWCEHASDIQVQLLIEGLAAHQPGLAGLIAHVMVELESTDGLCPPARARLKGEDAA